MSGNAHKEAWSSVKTLKTFGSQLSFDDDDRKGKKKKEKITENEFFNIYDYIQKVNCTLFYIGALPVSQKCYTCRICNPQEDKYLCEFCYFSCHQLCRKSKAEKMDIEFKENTYVEEKDKKGIKEFFCVCGNEYKHIPPASLINDFGPCELIKLDKALKLENFFCETHQIMICCVCSVQCHNKCKITKTKKVFDPHKSRRRMDKCLCRNECHTSYNEVAFTFPLNEYQKLSGIQIWPIQILNILFNNKRTFHKLSVLFTSILNKEEITEREEKKFLSLLTLFSNTFNRKFKTFYYHQDILEILNYENLIAYLTQIELKNTNNIIANFRFIFIFLFVHLRRDFQNIKSLTSIDFLCSSPLERIKYKILLGKQTMFNENIYMKYNNEKISEEKNISKVIEFDNICKLMEVGFKYTNVEKLAYEFEVGLKYICFILKRMLLTKDKLIQLTHYLINFFTKFYEYYKKKNPKIEHLLNIFQGIAEIVLMIAVSYNDLVIMDYLTKYKNESNIEDIKSLDDFIHIKSIAGSALFEIIIKSCDILKRHYERLPKRGKKINNINENIDKDTNIKLPENGGLFPEKIINLFTESLGIFCLADSFYFKQISSITKNDLINYYYFVDKFENNKSYNFNINEKYEIEKLLLDLKNNIENKFDNLFTSSSTGKALEINTKIYQDIFQFSESINRLMTIINSRKINNNNIQNKIDYNLQRVSTDLAMLDKPETIIQDNNSVNESENEMIKDIDKKNYWKKLALKNNNNYKFIDRMINNNAIMDEFVDILIISNVDETIGKVLSFLSNRKFPNLLTIELADIIYSTLSLYLYSKNGIQYFLMGKNLSRINKIINRFNYNSNNKNNNPAFGKTVEFNLQIMSRTIDFLLDISKGLKIYNLNIKFHKVLPRIKKNLLEHITMFNLVSNNNIIEFAIHFKKILKIFMNFQKDFKYEDFEDIKKKCVMIFEKNPSGLFDKNNFFKIINSVQSNQILNNNINNEININKKKLISLYFTFFKFVTLNTFYFYNNKETNKILNILLNFNDLNRIKSLFATNVFTIKQKYILLEYLRTLYFSDYLDEYDIFKQVSLLSNSDFEKLLKNNLITTHIIPNNNINNNIQIQNNNISQSVLMNKYQRINEIEIILDIYSDEIKKFPNQLNNCDLKHCELYFEQILLDVKYISTFFYCQKNNIFGKFKILFYGFTLDFLQKIDSFEQIHQKIRKGYNDNNNKIIIDDEISNDDENDWSIESKKIKEKINDMKSISFNIYNKKKIYCYLTESVDTLIKICKINLKYNLQNYLEYYDVMAESNFTPFSLLETLDYEYFYDEKAEESNEIIKKDHFLYLIENLKNSFINTFIDINNTNFLDVFTSTSGENYIHDYRKKYIDYFLSFINSNEGNDMRKLEVNLCIFTKMMFYDSEGMQSKLKDIKDNNDFFLNLNKDINKFSVLVFSLSKNIFAYDMAGEITNLNKLYIQFTQALGEGFNTTFHDKIFHIPRPNNIVPNFNNNKFNKFIDKYEEEKNESENLNYKRKYSENSQSRKALYSSIIDNLKYALYKLDLENIIDSELPYDKLIILISNYIDFIIEYISSTDENKNNYIIRTFFKKIFLGNKIKNLNNSPINDESIIIECNPCLKLFFSKIRKEKKENDFAIQRKKVICYTKIKLTQMLIYYLLTSGKENFVEKLVDKDFTTINLYSEVLFNFNDLIKHLELKNPELISQLNEETTVEGYTNKLINFYTYEENFRNMIELQLIFDMFILIKILEDNYKINRLKILFEKNKSNLDENTFDGNGDFNLGSKFSKGVYKFLNIIILKVEIKMDEDNDDDNIEYDESEENKENNITKKNDNEIMAKKIKNKIKKDRALNNLINIHKKFYRRKNVYPKEEINENRNNHEEQEESLSLSSNVEDSESSDYEDSEEESNIKTIFFPRPFLTFFLSKSIQKKFIDTVDRSKFSTKSISLLNYADYALFEMIVNKHIIGNSRFNNIFINLNYTYIEMINYLFIIVQNFLILFRFYKKTDDPYEEYFAFDENKITKLHHENMILAIIQMIFLGIFLIIWYRYKFLNSCQNNIMTKYNKPFVGQRINEERKISQVVVDYFQDKEVSNIKFFSEVNKDLTNWEKFYAIVISTHIINREINILFLSLILNICFLATKMPIFLVIQILFILNIISTLFDIVLAIQLKWKNIVLLLLFDFLCIYIFAWLAFFYFSYFFVFDEVMIPKSKETLTEGYCFSSVQCYLFMLNRGSLSNGGISEDLGMMSYKRDVSHYIGRFFFDVIFFLIISLYISKMFLSFIIDTFGELRETNTQNQNDKNNVCFICEIKRDQCLLKNIDFDKHVEQEHNLWNYVYFLNYLYVNNSLNFNWIENSVWEKLQNQGSNWLPSNSN